MKSIIKLTCTGILALGLSACSFSQGVLQATYDHKADSDCANQFGDQNSIHNNSKSSCLNGRHEPARNPSSKDWNKNETLKPSRELEPDF